MRQPVRERVLRVYDDRKKAEKWARGFDHAREFSGFPPLEVKNRGGKWAVIDTAYFPEKERRS